MKDIFKNSFFIITLAIAIVLSASSLALRLGGKMSFIDSAVGTALAPFEKASKNIEGFFTNISGYFTDYNALKEENAALKEQIKAMEEDVERSDELKRENDWLYNFLELKRSTSHYHFAKASVIAYSQINYLAAFTIDKGSSDGIEKGMPIITDQGLAGIVTDVSLNHSICTCAINPNFTVSAYTERVVLEGEEDVTVKSAESIVATGNFMDAASGCMRIEYIGDTSAIEIGDMVYTSGAGGIYPRGLSIGQVIDILNDEYSQSRYALVKTTVDINSVESVMVVTDFTGKAVAP